MERHNNPSPFLFLRKKKKRSEELWKYMYYIYTDPLQIFIQKKWERERVTMDMMDVERATFSFPSPILACMGTLTLLGFLSSLTSSILFLSSYISLFLCVYLEFIHSLIWWMAAKPLCWKSPKELRMEVYRWLDIQPWDLQNLWMWKCMEDSCPSINQHAGRFSNPDFFFFFWTQLVC